jgi:hypothetical protein
MCGAAYGSTIEDVRRTFKDCELMLWGQLTRGRCQGAVVDNGVV